MPEGEATMETSSRKSWARKLYGSIALFFAMTLSISFFPTIAYATQHRGIQVVINDASGKNVGLYRGSYALLIGASRYTKGWPNLESIPGEDSRFLVMVDSV
jgi:hypothetical protein